MAVQQGEVISFVRTFTVDDVRAFTAITGDVGRHHVDLDPQGRLMVQGLLTATLPTKIGGQVNYLAREMHFTFVRPVFTGDTIRCEAIATEVTLEPGRQRVAFTITCTNQHGKDVLLATTIGVILDEKPAAT